MMRTMREIEAEISGHRDRIEKLEVELGEARLAKYGVKVGDEIEYEGARYRVAGSRYLWVLGYPEKKGGGWSQKVRTLYNFKGK